nr:probable protein phosphatase 2C 68 [Lolium perenne]
MEDAVSVREALAAPAPQAAEDKESAQPRDFYGVFDGHGCLHVADACRDRMHELVAADLTTSVDPSPWAAAMERSFARMDAEVTTFAAARGATARPSCRCEANKCDHLGSTAVVAVVDAHQIVIPNCGDSRAVLCRDGGKPVALSSDHKPDRPDELARIDAAYFEVWNGGADRPFNAVLTLVAAFRRAPGVRR